MHPRVMTNRNLEHSESSLFELFGHLNTDHTAPGFQGYGFEDITAKKAEVAVDVPNGNPECPSHGSAVNFADANAIPCIGALHLVTIHEIDAGCEASQEIVQFADVVLSVAVGVENQILSSILEARDQSRAIAEISFMMDH